MNLINSTPAIEVRTDSVDHFYHDVSNNLIILNTASFEATHQHGYWYRGRAWSAVNMLWSPLAGGLKMLYHIAGLVYTVATCLFRHPQKTVSEILYHLQGFASSGIQGTSGLIFGALGILSPKRASTIHAKIFGAVDVKRTSPKKPVYLHV